MWSFTVSGGVRELLIEGDLPKQTGGVTPLLGFQKARQLYQSLDGAFLVSYNNQLLKLHSLPTSIQDQDPGSLGPGTT